MVFLENVYELGLLLHLFATFVLVGSMTHNLVYVSRYLRGKFARQKQEFFHIKVIIWVYLIVYITGALIYPAFRVHIRAAVFDPAMPWATGLFEVKEHWGALGLAVLLAWCLIRRTITPETDRLHLYYGCVPLCLIFNVLVWYKIIVGSWLTLLKGTVS
jgi:hypothetical protein